MNYSSRFLKTKFNQKSLPHNSQSKESTMMSSGGSMKPWKVTPSLFNTKSGCSTLTGRKSISPQSTLSNNFLISSNVNPFELIKLFVVSFQISLSINLFLQINVCVLTKFLFQQKFFSLKKIKLQKIFEKILNIFLKTKKISIIIN